jgi:hypothetical protein
MSGRVSYYGGIVKDGLIMDVDVAKLDSYPKNGTIWNDVSGNVNNLTLSGPVDYQIANNLFFLKGSTTYMYSNNFFPIEGPATICLLCKPTATGGRTFVSISNVTGTVGPFSAFQFGYRSGLGSSLSVWKYGGSVFLSSGTLTTGNWYYICVSYSTTSISTYINGVLISSVSSPILQTGLGRFLIGTYRHLPTPLEVMYGDIALCQYYNRILSDNEITQNFNAIKGRKGL